MFGRPLIVKYCIVKWRQEMRLIHLLYPWKNVAMLLAMWQEKILQSTSCLWRGRVYVVGGAIQ